MSIALADRRPAAREAGGWLGRGQWPAHHREARDMPFLDWANKAQAASVAGAVPYHLLNFESAHGDTASETLLIPGDDLLALKALLPFYRGRVKCVFIDPFNLLGKGLSAREHCSPVRRATRRHVG